ncbi:MAG: hypothetical protein IH958_07080 [Chloroflexi bacterium]|nr:hypothetical protein [Chloroflexota bacterium]
MNFQKELMESDSSFFFTWPEGTKEQFGPLVTYAVSAGNVDTRLAIGYGWRDAFRENRRRIIVFAARSSLWPIVEFVGADDYDRTSSVLWPLKKPGGNRQYRLSEEPHRDFAEFTVVPFQNRISGRGSFSGWAAVVHEDEHDAMLRLALVREKLRVRQVPLV